MKPRAKKQATLSIAGRVAKYDELASNKGKTGVQSARDLGISVSALYSARTHNNKKKSYGPVDLTLPLDEKDIVAISKIGLAKAERIIRLLRQLRGGV